MHHEAVQPESRFSGARPDCPCPERWHATDDTATEIEVTALVAAMVTALRPDYVVETGAHIGLTSYAIGTALAEQGYGELTTLETDPELAATAATRCAGLPVQVLEMSSLNFSPQKPVDFAWFDSLVDIRAIEYCRYVTKMHDRSVVGFHDTGPQHRVAGYLHQLVDADLLAPPLWLPTPRGVCFARPTAAALAGAGNGWEPT